MLEKTRGFVLKLTNYGDNSVVAQIYTERFGLQSYMIHGARKPKAKVRVNMLQPLQLLDMVVRHRADGQLQGISEVRLDPAFLTIPYDVKKSSVVLFINELLYKVLRQQGPDVPLFQFVSHTLVWLDAVEHMPADFHLYFLLRLTRFLGFDPGRYNEGDRFFDLKNGLFLKHEPQHPLVLAEPYTVLFARLTGSSLDQLEAQTLSLVQRRYLLGRIIDYYRFHIDNMGEIKSQAVLEEVLS